MSNLLHILDAMEDYDKERKDLSKHPYEDLIKQIEAIPDEFKVIKEKITKTRQTLEPLKEELEIVKFSAPTTEMYEKGIYRDGETFYQAQVRLASEIWELEKKLHKLDTKETMMRGTLTKLRNKFLKWNTFFERYNEKPDNWAYLKQIVENTQLPAKEKDIQKKRWEEGPEKEDEFADLLAKEGEDEADKDWHPGLAKDALRDLIKRANADDMQMFRRDEDRDEMSESDIEEIIATFIPDEEQYARLTKRDDHKTREEIFALWWDDAQDEYFREEEERNEEEIFRDLEERFEPHVLADADFETEIVRLSTELFTEIFISSTEETIGTPSFHDEVVKKLYAKNDDLKTTIRQFLAQFEIQEQRTPVQQKKAPPPKKQAELKLPPELHTVLQRWFSDPDKRTIFEKAFNDARASVLVLDDALRKHIPTMTDAIDQLNQKFNDWDKSLLKEQPYTVKGVLQILTKDLKKPESKTAKTTFYQSLLTFLLAHVYTHTDPTTGVLTFLAPLAGHKQAALQRPEGSPTQQTRTEMMQVSYRNDVQVYITGNVKDAQNFDDAKNRMAANWQRLGTGAPPDYIEQWVKGFVDWLENYWWPQMKQTTPTLDGLAQRTKYEVPDRYLMADEWRAIFGEQPQTLGPPKASFKAGKSSFATPQSSPQHLPHTEGRAVSSSSHSSSKKARVKTVGDYERELALAKERATTFQSEANFQRGEEEKIREELARNEEKRKARETELLEAVNAAQSNLDAARQADQARRDAEQAAALQREEEEWRRKQLEFRTDRKRVINNIIDVTPPGVRDKMRNLLGTTFFKIVKSLYETNPDNFAQFKRMTPEARIRKIFERIEIAIAQGKITTITDLDNLGIFERQKMTWENLKEDADFASSDSQISFMGCAMCSNPKAKTMAGCCGKLRYCGQRCADAHWTEHAAKCSK